MRRSGKLAGKILVLRDARHLPKGTGLGLISVV